MTPSAAEVLEAAKALPRAERAEVAEGILATLGTADVQNDARLAALKSAVDDGVASLDAGEGIEIPLDGMRDYLRNRGRLASERAETHTA